MHAHYFYTSDRVKALLQETTFLFHFYPSPFSTLLWKLLIQYLIMVFLWEFKEFKLNLPDSVIIATKLFTNRY